MVQKIYFVVNLFGTLRLRSQESGNFVECCEKRSLEVNNECCWSKIYMLGIGKKDDIESIRGFVEDCI